MTLPVKVLAALGLLGIAALGVFLAYPSHVDRKADPLRPSVEFTSLYNVAVRPIKLPFMSNYGGVDNLGNDLLVASRVGRFWILNENYEPARLDYQVDPTNFDAFTGSEVAAAMLNPYREGWHDRAVERFGVKDILVVPGNPVGLYATYTYWHGDERCITLRVGALEITADATPVTAGADWRVLYETQPCLSLNEDGGYLWMEDAGGRLVHLPDGRLLLSVGEFGFDGMKSDGNYYISQEDGYHYGKMIAIDPISGAASIYTKGHRNPQGLTVTGAGEIYSTEHGPVGGDELNLIIEGENYGWPFVSYGRACIGEESCAENDGLAEDSRLNWNIGEHAGDYRLPVFSWVPSVGISNLISLRGTLFERWKDDLLVTSLKQKTLYRLRVREGRVVFAEPLLTLGVRGKIRDLVEMSDGRVIVKPDTDVVFELTPEVGRRAEVVAQCSACHTFRKGQGHGIGPNLWGVLNRPVASASDYEYSPALRQVDGSWSADRLQQYLIHPDQVAPGTTMAFNLTKPEDADVAIGFLETLTD